MREINIDSAVEQLTDLTFMLGNIIGGGSAEDTGEVYLATIERVEPVLRNYFADPAVWGRLYGARNSAIRDIMNITPLPWSLVTEEASDQKRHIQQLIEELKRFDKWTRAAPGVMVVIDKYVLLHYQPPRNIPWCRVLAENDVRPVLPLRVVKELEAKKYLAKDDLADRAQRLRRDLWKLVGPVAGRPAPVSGQPRVTVEVPAGDDPRDRTFDADEEILNRFATMKSLGAKGFLVTGDTGMSLRAGAISRSSTFQSSTCAASQTVLERVMAFELSLAKDPRTPPPKRLLAAPACQPETTP